MPPFRRIALFALLLALSWPSTASLNSGGSLRFFGNGVNDIDRVKIPLGPSKPVNVDGTFMLEFWLKAEAGANTGTVTCNSADGWITGNIIFDRDIYGPGDYGDYGVALNTGRVAFGVNVGNSGTTLCGATSVANSNWHHVAVTRDAAGPLKIFVDGVLDASDTGPSGDVSYREGRATSYPNSDPFLVIGAEKHDAGAAYPSFSGWVDEVRVSNTLRYTANFTPPTAPFTTDANTVALYHFDEGSGNTVTDTSGAAGGPSNGVRHLGGSPAGPQWSTDMPFSASVICNSNCIYLPLVRK